MLRAAWALLCSLVGVKTSSGKRSLAPPEEKKTTLKFNQATLSSDASISSSHFTTVNN